MRTMNFKVYFSGKIVLRIVDNGTFNKNCISDDNAAWDFTTPKDFVSIKDEIEVFIVERSGFAHTQILRCISDDEKSLVTDIGFIDIANVVFLGVKE